MVEITCEDCMDLMARYPDKYFDLAVCDPPYGIREDWMKRKSGYKTKNFIKTSYKNDQIPSQ